MPCWSPTGRCACTRAWSSSRGSRHMSEFLNLLAAGLTSGAIYGIFGACLAVWFRVCNVLNLAVGDFAMIGAIGAAQLVQNAGLPFGAGIVIALAAAGL